MKEKWDAIYRQEETLDRELDYLHEEGRAHNASWDSHIITLAMAAIGFSFTAIPLSKVCHLYLLIFSLLCFVLSIGFSLVNFIFSDKSIKSAIDGNIKRRGANIKARHRLYDLESELETYQSIDTKRRERAGVRADRDIMDIYENTNTDKGIEEVDAISKTIRFLNHAKTYSFILGVSVITIFCGLNIDNFSN